MLLHFLPLLIKKKQNKNAAGLEYLSEKKNSKQIILIIIIIIIKRVAKRFWRDMTRHCQNDCFSV